MTTRIGDILPEVLAEARAEGERVGRQRATRPTRTPREGPGPKGRTGRPVRLHEGLVSIIVRKIEDGSPVNAAAIASGVPASTYHSWVKRGKDARALEEAGVEVPQKERIFLDFLNRTEAARHHAMVEAVVAHQRLAFGGEVLEIIEHFDPETEEVTGRTVRFSKPNRMALEWYLEKSHPTEFGTRRLEITGADGGPIPVDVEVSARETIKKHLSQVAQRLGVEDEES